MLDHHIQKTIVYQLAFADGMRFSDLKPDDIDNKLFTYHLKKTVSEGLVTKTDEGTYTLTPEGRRVGKGALKRQSRMINRAYSLLLLAVQRPSDGAWLLSRRQTQPLLDMIGFMQAQPTAETTAIETAAASFHENTNLSGEFTVHGDGYFRIYRNDELESFIHFTLLICTNPTGELTQNDPNATYYWDNGPDFEAKDMLPTMPMLRDMLNQSAGSFQEQEFRI